MQQVTVDEFQFYSFHEQLKKDKARIIRCLERNGPKGLKLYTITYLRG